jgi:hypothetical protein
MIPPITSIPPITPIPAIPIRVDADAAGPNPDVLRRRLWDGNATGENYDACGNCRAQCFHQLSSEAAVDR